MSRFKQGERVYWDIEKTKIPIGTGVVCGLATTGAPFIGCMTIVSLDRIVSDQYPFSAVVIPEVFLRLERTK